MGVEGRPSSAWWWWWVLAQKQRVLLLFLGAVGAVALPVVACFLSYALASAVVICNTKSTHKNNASTCFVHTALARFRHTQITQKGSSTVTLLMTIRITNSLYN
jgi:hypothetical protein